MAHLSETTKTLLAQGKFIQAPDYRIYDARARALRAEALQQTAAAIVATVRGWFGRRVPAANHAGQSPARAA